MRTNEFDELIRSRFDQNDFAYNPEHWNRLSRQLAVVEKKQPRVIILWAPLIGVAASLALFATACLFLYKSEGLYRSSKNIASRQQPVNNSINRDIIINAPALHTGAGQPAAHSSLRLLALSDTKKQNHRASGYKAPVTAAYHATATAQPALNASPLLKAHLLNTDDLVNKPEPIIGLHDKFKETPTLIWEQKSYALDQRLQDISPDQEAKTKNQEKKNLSLTGGVNYGSLNAGYMLGANGHTMLGNRLYIEGDVAFVNNTNTVKSEYTAGGNFATGPSTNGTDYSMGSSPMVISVPPPQPMAVVNSVGHKPTSATGSSSSGNTTNTPASTGNSSAGSSSGASTIVRYDQYQFSYLQFAPVLGYKVEKHLSIGIGADMQQLVLDNQPENTVSGTTDMKTVPNVDFGFIGKTEYAISSKIKAVVLYRGDMNGMLNNKEINRSYLQFQLKLSILSK